VGDEVCIAPCCSGWTPTSSRLVGVLDPQRRSLLLYITVLGFILSASSYKREKYEDEISYLPFKLVKWLSSSKGVLPLPLLPLSIFF